MESMAGNRDEETRSVYLMLADEQLSRLSGKHARIRAERKLGKGWTAEVVSLYLPEVGDTRMILLESESHLMAFKLEELDPKHACCLTVMEA